MCIVCIRLREPSPAQVPFSIINMEAKVISGTRLSTLPRSYIRPKSDRPKLSQVAVSNNIPVIDLGCQDWTLIVAQIGNACQEYGFFQVL